MTGKITLEGDSEQPLMRVGVARRDSNHHNAGLVMVLDTAEEMNTILTNLNPNRAFQRLCARDHTQILVIDANTEVITYCAEVEGGVYSSTLGQYDHTGLQVSMFGIGEDVLRDESLDCLCSLIELRLDYCCFHFFLLLYIFESRY